MHARRATHAAIPLTLLLAALLAVGLGQVPATWAALVETTVTIVDLAGSEGLAKVSVADAGTAEPIASGLSDELGRFTFRSEEGRLLEVTAHTRTGFVGSGRLNPGGAARLLADHQAPSLPTTPYRGQTATLTYRDPSGVPIGDAPVSVVNWSTFAQIARGRTDANGQFTFQVPDSRMDYLGTFWKDGQTDGLEVAVNDGPGEDPGGDYGFPGF